MGVHEKSRKKGFIDKYCGLVEVHGKYDYFFCECNKGKFGLFLNCS